MLVRLLYVSRAMQALTPGLLDGILDQSRTKNPKVGITGLLCFRDDIFVQVIEGGRDAVNDLYNAIVRDPRHKDVRLLSFEDIAERRFSNWVMGKVNIDTINPGLLLKYSDRPVLNPYGMPAHATMALLLELASAGAIANRGQM
jgi:hypothetical protein